MKRVLLVAVLATLCAADSRAQQSAAAESNEVAPIRAVAQLYISADPGNLRQAFQPDANLYTTDGKGGLRVIPFAGYVQRVSANPNAAADRLQTNIDSVDRAGDVAVVRITTIRRAVRVTDYLSMVRFAGTWKIVSKTFFVEQRASSEAAAKSPTPDAAANPCAAPDHRVFDFMLGTWRTNDPATGSSPASEGKNTVESMLNGCIIHEHRRISRNGTRLFDGDAYWGYDSVKKQWLLFYLDDLSHMQVYEGRLEAGHLAFYRERPDPDGKLILIRIVYAPLAGGGYTQAVERSADHGATWQPGGTTTYQSKR